MKPKQLFDFNKPLHGRRLQLQRLGPEDATFLEQSFSNHEFWAAYRCNQDRQTLGQKLTQRLDFESQQHPDSLGKIEWVVATADASAENPASLPIGFAGLTAFNRAQSRAEFLLGILDLESQRPGTGLEASLLIMDFAFNQAGLNKLTSYVYADNPRAQQNTLSLGFENEGLLRQHFRQQGTAEFLDVFQNGMLQSDFRSNARLSRLSVRLLGRDVTRESNEAKGKVSSSDGGSDIEASFEMKL